MTRSMLGRKLLVWVSAAAMVLMSACTTTQAPATTAPSPAPAPQPQQPAPPVVLKKVKMAAFRASFVNYPIYVADQLGIFKKHGLDVELVYATGAQVTTAVVSGATEFGGFSVENLVSVVGQKQDVRLLVLNQTSTPFTIIVRNEVPTPNIDKPYPEMLKDLKGLKIGISTPGAGTDNTLRYLLREAGLDPDKDVEIIPIGAPDTQIAALQRGQVDGTIAFEPIQTQAIFGLKIAKSILDLQAREGPKIFREYAYNGVAAQGKYIDANPEIVKAMVAAIVEACEIINNPATFEQAMGVALKEMEGIDPGALREYVTKYKGIFSPVASKAAMDNVNTVLLDSKRITGPVPYERVVDKSMPTSFKY